MKRMKLFSITIPPQCFIQLNQNIISLNLLGIGHQRLEKTVSIRVDKKILNPQLGTQKDQNCSPFFILCFTKETNETLSEVLFGTLAYSGNFRFCFDVDSNHQLRIISGINNYQSEYHLKSGEVFETPEFIFTYSDSGKGKASRSLHSWARKYQIKNGDGSRLTLLNNWEATFFNFDEEILMNAIDNAQSLGVELFLLDDGWFGNKYPRRNDGQGLGDWQETTSILSHGIPYLDKYSQ
jgi:alpha-galactosidase